MRVYSRQEFKDYCLRRLGAPVVEINVDDEQVEDRIDDALQYYYDYHFDGTEKVLAKYPLTINDINAGILTMPESVIGVTNVFNINTSMSSSDMFSIRYQIAMTDLYSLSKISIAPYAQTMQSLAEMDDVFSTRLPYRFNRRTGKVYFDQNLGSVISPGQFLVFEVYVTVNPEDNIRVWADRWLQRYATVLIKRQWGENLKKFEGIEMLNGITFSGQKIYDEAVEEISQLESEMLSSYSLPPALYIG